MHMSDLYTEFEEMQQDPAYVDWLIKLDMEEGENKHEEELFRMFSNIRGDSEYEILPSVQPKES